MAEGESIDVQSSEVRSAKFVLQPRTLTCLSQARQRLIEVSNEIVGILDAERHPHQLIGDADGGAIF